MTIKTTKKTEVPRRTFVTLERPLKKGEVRHGVLTKGQGTLIFDETDESWTTRRQRSYVLRTFPHGRLRRLDNGNLRIRLEFPVGLEDYDLIQLGQELGDIAEYVCKYQERRKQS